MFGGCRGPEDVIVAHFEHGLVPGNHQFSLRIFSLDNFEDLAHGGGLLGGDSFVIVGWGFKSLGAS